MIILTPVETDEEQTGGDPERERSVPARVARAIQDMVAERYLQPGDPLPSQRELAGMLQASRPSVREGISMLETLGLIRVEKRKGLFVAAAAGRLPAEFWPSGKGYGLREVFEFRVGFEPQALALAFPFLKDKGLQRLRLHAEALMLAARQGNAVAAAEEDTAFHDVIFDHCRNPIFRDIRRHLSKVMQESQWVPMVIIERVRDTAREHFAIVDAIEANDSAAACAALTDHIRAAARRCDIELAVPHRGSGA
ncbi:FadR/GntR family transcriptional regulator [uncultured Roseibium sp.]|uniref:FadR/GntR family transcriptional regulator n=1 Tax=uncultured Roseibium sp. TaxID=1936171 RepID=UPI002615E3F6|nr:FCD domain-containing protein [uncultured Roseibium sp.]